MWETHIWKQINQLHWQFTLHLNANKCKLYHNTAGPSHIRYNGIYLAIWKNDNQLISNGLFNFWITWRDFDNKKKHRDYPVQVQYTYRTITARVRYEYHIRYTETDILCTMQIPEYKYDKQTFVGICKSSLWWAPSYSNYCGDIFLLYFAFDKDIIYRMGGWISIGVILQPRDLRDASWAAQLTQGNLNLTPHI